MRRRHLLPVLLGAAVLAVDAGAAMVEVPLEVVAGRASVIVQGKVTGQRSRWTEDGGTIVTDVTVRVSEALKGGAGAGDEVTFQVEGGEVGEVGIWVEHQPRFLPDQEVLLFLRPAEGGALAVQCAEQGRYTVFASRAYDYRGRLRELPRLKADVRLMVERDGR